jgi:antibiotic biosynthesis monooxygenase (ABM) superfamily enzyme
VVFANNFASLKEKITLNVFMKVKLKLIASLKTWVVIYPSITVFYYLFGEQLSAVPLYQRTFILTVSLVLWMTFVGGPIAQTIIDKVKQIITAHE